MTNTKSSVQHLSNYGKLHFILFIGHHFMRWHIFVQNKSFTSNLSCVQHLITSLYHKWHMDFANTF